MAITSTPYPSFLNNLIPTDGYGIVLVTSSYTPTPGIDVDYNAIKSFEVANDSTTGGYNTGGKSLTNVAVAVTSGATRLTADAVEWSVLTATLRYAVIIRTTTGIARLVGFIDLGTDRSFSGEPFQLSFTSGILVFTPTA